MERLVVFLEASGSAADLSAGDYPIPKWPLPAVVGEPVDNEFSAAVRCAVISWADARQIQESAHPSFSDTWVSGGRILNAAVRPLLPDEQDCGSVVAGRPDPPPPAGT